MQVLLYEFACGGGTFSWGCSPGDCPTFLSEGSSMLRSLARDFSQVTGIGLVTLRDSRLPMLDMPGCEVVLVGDAAGERDALERHARRADWTILVAPESDGALLDRCRWVEASRGRLLGPNAEFVALASNKHATVEFLAAAGVPVPFGICLRAGDPLPRDFPFPAVLKPLDGAGSQGIRLVDSADAAATEKLSDAPRRLEQYHAGEPASVALLLGPSGAAVLEPCSQILSTDGRFEYRGGRSPLPPSLANRARRLAGRVADALPPLVGYLGIDMVLTRDAEESGIVVEINPRMTTSYLGLRALCRDNLAKAMLDMAEGRPVALSFGREQVEFAPDRLLAGAGAAPRWSG
jgi:predicted ATP-grasp superfamily ATP-dependent carboligase